MCRTSEIDDSLAALSPKDRADVLELRKAFAFLYRGLHEAKQRFETDQDAGRNGALDALETVVKYLNLFEPVRAENLHAPFAALCDALVNLDDGAVAPLLKPRARRGRPIAGAMRESMIGAIVFTVNRLHATGLGIPDAHGKVARVLHDAGVTAARGKFREVTARTVRGWCEDVAADVARHHEAAQVCAELEHDPELTPPAGTEPAEARRFYLRALATFITSLPSVKTS